MASDTHALATVEHSPVGSLAHDTRGGISNPVLGMLLFITSEVMFFAAFFGALETEFGARRGETSLVFSISAFLYFQLGFPAGLIADRVGVVGAAIGERLERQFANWTEAIAVHA